jgi:toxic protein SymE
MSERRLKVSSVTQPKTGQRDRTVASIRLSGKWLEEAGFQTGDRFVVEATPGCVVLRAESSKAER